MSRKVLSVFLLGHFCSGSFLLTIFYLEKMQDIRRVSGKWTFLSRAFTSGRSPRISTHFTIKERVFGVDVTF